ncbi:hypothetical protein I41_25490 [Lacipirellula limnantheis]|uniref:Uncharacterized protein n=2 Tax=Lacipirellula limnantheis TaxID=2528024 RepID=A0A517TYB1_9BACT|nr:hypothetical protein I41_25490 [Lacipirellula limnantheis]
MALGLATDSDRELASGHGLSHDNKKSNANQRGRCRSFTKIQTTTTKKTMAAGIQTQGLAVSSVNLLGGNLGATPINLTIKPPAEFFAPPVRHFGLVFNNDLHGFLRQLQLSQLPVLLSTPMPRLGHHSASLFVQPREVAP